MGPLEADHRLPLLALGHNEATSYPK
jgi:hypothetical protein